LPGREVKVSRVARMFAISVIVLAAASGLVFGLLLPSVARADDPPTTTVPTPTLPEPDPAPPKTTPKPTPKATPKTSTSRQVSHAPAYTQPAATPAPTVHAQVKPKTKKVVRHKKVRHKKVVVTTETTTTLPTVTSALVGATLGTKSGGSFNLGSLLVVLGLSLAIACLAIAVVPATYVRWRPAAIFVSERQVDLTVIGLGLLVVTAFMLVLTKGP
jgi:hypothetical protein